MKRRTAMKSAAPKARSTRSGNRCPHSGDSGSGSVSSACSDRDQQRKLASCEPAGEKLRIKKKHRPPPNFLKGFVREVTDLSDVIAFKDARPPIRPLIVAGSVTIRNHRVLVTEVLPVFFKASTSLKSFLRQEPPEDIRAFVFEEKMAILERALVIGIAIHTKEFAFNNDHGRSNWYERMGKPIVARLRSNGPYMRAHGNDLGTLFGRDGMQHLKEWFVSTRKQEALHRMKDGTGASGGKTEGDFNKLRRDVFACNPAVTRAPEDDTGLGLGSLLDAERVDEDGNQGDEDSGDNNSDGEAYAQEEDNMAERASGLGTPERVKPDAKAKGRMKGFDPSQFQQGFNIFSMANERASSYESQKIDILKQVFAADTKGKSSGSTSANSVEKRKVSLQEKQRNDSLRESRLNRGKEMFEMGFISKEKMVGMYADFMNSEPE